MNEDISLVPSTNKKDMSAFYIPVAIIIAGLLIAGALYGALASKSANVGTAQKAVNIKDVQIDGEPFIGKENAPVTLAYWFDYQCPYCKAVEVGGIPQIPITPAMPALIKNYVDTGKLKIVFKDFAFLGDDSFTAADYAHAIWKLYPAKFYEWHEAMFVAQDEEHGGFGDEASIIALTRKIAGVDVNAVKADVAAHVAEYKAEAEEDAKEASKFGISGTPGFITGKTLIPGAVELASFTSAIDPQLK